MFRLLRLTLGYSNLRHISRPVSKTFAASSSSGFLWNVGNACDYSCKSFVQLNTCSTSNVWITPFRQSSILTSVPASELWKSVTGVSNAGKKKGRGKRKGRKKITDLNRGQSLGTGKANFQWPGLNAPVIKGRMVLKQAQMPPDPLREQALIRLRDRLGKIKYRKEPALLRGYSGSKFPGRKVGPPDPVQDTTFEDFETIILEFKLVTNMTGTLGRKQRFSAFVVTGNGNGLAGLGLGKSRVARTAIRIAKNRAVQRLVSIPRYEDRTVYHNMYSQFYKTQMFIHHKPQGYGLVCHRVIKSCCQMIGIKDLHCKIEAGPKFAQNVAKAFFNAIISQETHAELADRMGYHVVEIQEEHGGFPVVVASPSNGKVKEEELKDEEQDIELDFDRMYYGGKPELLRPTKKPPWYNLPSYKKKMRIVNARRNQPHAQLMREAGLW